MLRDISLHIHDLAENSVAAGATQIDVMVCAKSDGYLYVEIQDNGCGMSEELLSRVTDPFTTSRTTRKVGMGIPFFKMACEQASGTFQIQSEIEKGTKTCGSFQIRHIDRLPLGNLGETLSMLILEKPEIRYTVTASSEQGTWVFDTDTVRDVLEDTPIQEYEVLQWIKGYVEEHTRNIFGGVLDEIIGRT
ncbi:MAG: sensor histidine kinase [Clostridia bacterium]|nr:sensor histidine kinase [Clostridia bacterium]